MLELLKGRVIGQEVINKGTLIIPIILAVTAA